MSTSDQPTEEELRAAYEAEIKKIRVEQILLEQVVSLINLGMRRTGLSPGDRGRARSGPGPAVDRGGARAAAADRAERAPAGRPDPRRAVPAADGVRAPGRGRSARRRSHGRRSRRWRPRRAGSAPGGGGPGGPGGPGGGGPGGPGGPGGGVPAGRVVPAAVGPAVRVVPAAPEARLRPRRRTVRLQNLVSRAQLSAAGACGCPASRAVCRRFPQRPGHFETTFRPAAR